jgi:hypothetical protein
MALLGQLSPALLRELADALALVLGWSEETAEQEIKRTAALLSKEHGVRLQ